MKILLIQPPFTIYKSEARKCHPPLGLAYIAAALKNGHQVEVLDVLAEGYDTQEHLDKNFLRYGLSFEDIARKIRAVQPNIVGVSCLFTAQSKNVFSICRAAKEIDRNIVTVLGGAHPSTVPHYVLSDKHVDFVVIGEGEVTLKNLLDRIEKKSKWNDLPGLGYKQGSKIRVNPVGKFIQDLDTLEFPRWEILPLEKYFQINNPHGNSARKTPFFPLITSRGCPFECVFCSVHNLWGRNYRKRSANNVLAEIAHLVNRFKVKEIMFEDDNLTLEKNRAEMIFQGMIDRDFQLQWSVPNGVAVQTLDTGMLKLMRRSGCYSISLGVESGDEYILKQVIKKPVSLEQVRPIISFANRLGMETSVFFVVGVPGETRLSLKNTFRFARSLKANNINYFFATALPGTTLERLCKEKGLMANNIEYDKLKSDYPNFATDDFSIEYLASKVKQEKIKLFLMLMIFSPMKFFSKLLCKIKNEPGYFARFICKNFRYAHVNE